MSKIRANSIESLDGLSLATTEDLSTINQRTIYVGSVAELEALPSPITGQEALVSGVPFKYSGVSWEPSHGYVTPEIFGANPSAGFDNLPAFQNALEYLDNLGGGTLICAPSATYEIEQITRPALSWPSNITIDLNDSILQRTGANIADPFIETKSGETTVNHRIMNGTIRGTGAENGVSDQGSAILMLDCNGVWLENIKTENTNGDGLQARNAENVTGINCRIGTYGRNGVSPTSGSFIWRNLKIDGPAIAGANPGHGYDAENNSDTEVGVHHIDGGYCKTNMIFVDLYSSGGGTFNHEVYLNNFKIGPVYKPLRFEATNEIAKSNIYVGPGVEIIGNGSNASGLVIINVSGVQLFSPKISKGTTTDSTKAIQIEGVVNDLYSIGTKIDQSFIRGLECVGGSLSGSFLSGSDWPGVLLLDGSSNNTFSNGRIGTSAGLDIRGAASVGNKFDISFRIDGNVVYSEGALESEQEFGVIKKDIRMKRTSDTVGAQVEFEGRASYSQHSLGRLKFFSEGNETSGAVIESQGASVNLGDIRIFTSGAGAAAGDTALIERLRVTEFGNVRPGEDNLKDLGEASFRWSEIFAGNSVINTSDEREKEQIRSLSDKEKAVAARLKSGIKAFKWSESVAEKGDGARIHFGSIAQEIASAFKAEGLNPDDYGMFCFDEWSETPEVVETWEDEFDESGTLVREAGSRVVQQYVAAGNRYGVRYNELLAFIISAL